jgi:hypothetical protein
MNIRRLVVDVDKAIARPSIPDIAAAIEAVPNVEGVNVTVTEIDLETIGMAVTIEGANLDYDQRAAAIESAGAVVHSIDQLISGRRMVDYIARSR